NTDIKERNLTSRICPINTQLKTAKDNTVIPITADTNRWLNSMTNSAVISEGKSCPLHKVQLVLHPPPESVFVTNAPPKRINNIPIVETTDSHLTVIIMI